MKNLTKITGFFFIFLGWLCPFAGAGATKAAKTALDAEVTADSPIYLRHGAADQQGRYLDLNIKSDKCAPQHWNHYSGHCSGHCNHWSHHSHCNGW